MVIPLLKTIVIELDLVLRSASGLHVSGTTGLRPLIESIALQPDTIFELYIATCFHWFVLLST
jgi:hypothetical protein